MHVPNSMTNSEIVEKIDEAISLMELLDFNSFKINAFRNLSAQVEKTSRPLRLHTEEEILQSFSKTMARNILDLLKTESFPEFDELEKQIPAGVRSMLQINGIGPKKVNTLWKEAGIDSIEGLKQACLLSQVSQLKGFGTKIQDTILAGISFIESNYGKLLMHHAEALAEKMEAEWKSIGISGNIRVGDLVTRNEVVSVLEFLFPVESRKEVNNWLTNNPDFEIQKEKSGPFHSIAWYFPKSASCCFFFAGKEEFAKQHFVLNTSAEHWNAARQAGIPLYSSWKKGKFESDEALYQQLNKPYVSPELRTGRFEWLEDFQEKETRLIEVQDLKGCIHNHSTYSDGKNSLEEMANWCIAQGYQYFGIADHSKTALYANGLYEERVQSQWKEINSINSRTTPFRILKGIESDILGDGALDYGEETLKGFDYVVASVHSGMKMDKETATTRLITSIENPYTSVLGHCSGRILLKRPGYPLDYTKIIDACVSNHVAIELNAHPSRLDMDWQNLARALDKGAIISINPDAHEAESMAMMKYGVWLARKAGASAQQVLNAWDLDAVIKFFNSRR